MRAVSAIIFSTIWLIVMMMVGMLIVTNLTAHANDSGQLTGNAATHWNTFITFVWIAFSIMAFTPLILVLVLFSGLFSGLSGQGE
ncbi:hypothetical protein J7K27_05290 [Candidatus Bathyarchaeota archaeon]|nr:hypothetical protein [Candidatus Bathyarchaeota archaeon]